MKKIIISIVFEFVISQAQAQQVKHHFLLFWRSDCVGCHMAIPQLVKKAAECDTSKFTIMTISFDTDSVSYFSAIKQLKMEGFKNKYNFSQGYINNPLAKKYGVTKTPTLLYVDAQGKVLATMQEAYTKLSSLK